MFYKDIEVNHIFCNKNHPEVIYLNGYIGALHLTGRDKGIFDRSGYFDCGDSYIDLGEFKFDKEYLKKDE